MKFVKSLFGFVLMCSFYASAEDVRIFYFTTSTGEEIRVAAEKEVDGRIGYTLDVPQQVDPENAFRDLVSSTLAGENYHYVIEKPCADCQVSLGSKQDDLVASKAGKPVMRKVRLTSKAEIANTVIEGAALQVGSRSVDAVVGRLQADTIEHSQFQIVMSAQNKPVMVCAITSSGCKEVPDVTVANFGDGNIGFYISMSENMDERERSMRIEQALIRYIKSIGYKCRMTYTGSGDNLVAQMVCYPAFQVNADSFKKLLINHLLLQVVIT